MPVESCQQNLVPERTSRIPRKTVRTSKSETRIDAGNTPRPVLATVMWTLSHKVVKAANRSLIVPVEVTDNTCKGLSLHPENWLNSPQHLIVVSIAPQRPIPHLSLLSIHQSQGFQFSPVATDFTTLPTPAESI